MKQWSRIAGAAAMAVAGVALAAPAAHANSFTDRAMFGGVYSYSDGGDRFCVTVKNVSGLSIRVTLRPDTAPLRGPEFNYTVGAGKTVCKSLATAYEDTHYFVGFDTNNGSGGAYTTDKFYS